MGRRILAFFLGFLFGIIFVFGAVVAAVYIGINTVTPGDVYPDSNKFLGDLANLSLYEIYESVTKLYQEKIGTKDENGRYFTLGEFCEHYNIDVNQMFGGKEVPEDVLDIPVFELFAGNRYDAMQQVKVSAFAKLANLFSAGEDGGGIFSDAAIEKLSEHNLAELFDSEKGVAYVMQDLLLTDILPGIFPTEQADGNAIMWALGQSSIGKLLGGFGGNILLQFKQNGAFEAVGNLKMKDLFGESSAVLSVIFKEYKLSDLIADDGSINPDALMNSVFLGELLGYQRNKLTAEETEGFEQIESNENRAVLQNGDKFVIRSSDTDGEFEYYEGRLFCTIEQHTHGAQCGEPNEEGSYACGKTAHMHDANCYGYVWYTQQLDRATGLYTIVADITIGDLLSGDSNALIERFLDVQLGEILEGQQVDGAIDHLKGLTIRELMYGGIDGIYFGVLFEYNRKQVEDLTNFTPVDGLESVMYDGNGTYVRKDATSWFVAELNCEETDPDHQHNAKCYPFEWYSDEAFENKGTGVKAALSNTTVGELPSINQVVKNLKLKDVLGEDEIPAMLKGLKNTKIGELSTAINDMYLGEFLEYHREEVDGVFVWYTCNPEDGKDHTHDESCLATGMMGKLADQKVSELGNISETVMSFTLYDVLGEDIPQMLKSIKDTKIKDLNTAINDMYLGDLLEYHSETVEGKLVWYTCNPDGSHVHDDGCLATGVMGKLAGEKISGLGNLNDTIMSFTLKDVLGDKVPNSLKSIENTPISDMEEAINKIYLGQFLEYDREQVDDLANFTSFNGLEEIMKNGNGTVIRKDGDKWYLTNDCTESHIHITSCYYFVWYSCKEQNSDGHLHNEGCIVNGVMGKLASIPLGDMSAGRLTSVINDTKLNEVIDVNGNALLSELGDVKVRDLSTQLNTLYVGTAMGYFRLEAQGNSGYYIYDAAKDKNFNAKLICTNTSESHVHGNACYGFIWYECTLASAPDDHVHDASCAQEVKGLNAKMSNLTLTDLSNGKLGTVLESLTMGDLVDSGMISEISGDNAYKLAILTCKNSEHKCTETDNLLTGSKSHACTLADYFTYLAMSSQGGHTVTAEEFWNHTHENADVDDDHKDAWKNLLLTQFIDELLGAF